MKINKKGVLAILTLLSLVTAPLVYANEGEEHGGPDPVKRMERLKEKLGLNDDQVAKIKSLFESEKADREALRKKFHDGMAGILTPDQLAKFDELAKEKREKMKERWADKKKSEESKS